jgi:TPR repeat protein
MKTLRNALSVCVLLTCAAAVCSSAANPPPSPPRHLIDSALAGSPASASKLAQYYKDDERVISYWRQIAAENGDPIQQYNLWFDLKQKSDLLSQKRALYWLRRSAAAGDKTAAEALARLKARH